MSVFAILLLLLLGNWLLFDWLFFIPLNLISKITSFSWSMLVIFALVFLGWCLGDD